MDHLDCPSPEVWQERQQWVEELIFSYENKGGSYLLSEQACALTADVQSAFCAGAWVAVVVLAVSVVDAQLQETEVPGFKGNTKDLIDVLGLNPKLHRLRKRRNQLVHVNIDNPAITVDQQSAERKDLEAEAREAIELMFEAFFINAGI
jgi:hypothetical protein